MTTALVTGANRGIGLELCKQLRHRGADVIAVVRETSPALSALDVEVVEGVDVTESAGLSKLVAALEGRTLDLLINNAGLLGREQLEGLDPDPVRRQFEVNALGPLRVTAALLGNLGEGSKVAMITSRMGSIADNGSGGAYGYRMSKAALNAAGKSLSIDLRPRGIAVALLHPGWVKTEMTGQTGHVTPEEAAKMLMQRIDALSVENSGSFWHANGEPLPW